MIIYEIILTKKMHPHVKVEELDDWLEKKEFLKARMDEGIYVNEKIGTQYPTDLVFVDEPNHLEDNGGTIISQEYYIKDSLKYIIHISEENKTKGIINTIEVSMIAPKDANIAFHADLVKAITPNKF